MSLNSNRSRRYIERRLKRVASRGFLATARLSYLRFFSRSKRGLFTFFVNLFCCIYVFSGITAGYRRTHLEHRRTPQGIKLILCILPERFAIVMTMLSVVCHLSLIHVCHGTHTDARQTDVQNQRKTDQYAGLVINGTCDK